MWYGQPTTTHDGVDAARAGAITHFQSSFMEVARRFPEGQVAFWCRVSSETSFDYLRFYVDGVQGFALSGESGWVQQVSRSPPGRTRCAGSTPRMGA